MSLQIWWTALVGRVQRRGWLLLLGTGVFFSVSSSCPLWAERAQERSAHTWKTLKELSPAESAQIDLRTDTPRHAEFPYLPAEAYPFSVPFTAEEMGYRSMEFTQRPRWSCALANLFGSISSEGSLLGQGRAVNLIHYPTPEGAAVELSKKPGEEVYRQLTQQVFPPESYTSQVLVIRYRTDQQFVKKEDMFSYSPALRRVRHQNSMRRNDRFPQMAMTLDDASGRSAWEYSWTVLGTDVLFTTVRFPVTRPTVLITEADGSSHERTTSDLKLMGDEYPYYTPGGGVECYVVDARPKAEWLPDYHASHIVYWLEKHSFFPLRTETYDQDGKLSRVEVRLTKLVHKALGERGYSPFIQIYWDVASDILTYNIRDGIRLMPWSPADTRTYFSPDFMRRKWYLVPVKNLAASCEAFTKTILTATVACVAACSPALAPGSECTPQSLA
ncbi:MAG: outer membrane lipoprotein-sorting protein, partial [Candidatus Binatia bacterium]